jgi:hypothetical protein
MWTQLFASNFGVSGFNVIVLRALHGFQYLEPHIRPWSSKVLAAIHEPLESADKQNDTESDDTVVCES